MTFAFGSASRAKLAGVHPALVKRMNRAIALSTQDFSILEGVRTKERQAALYAQGRTKPGKIVTWTMNSNHFAAADGFGHAVDVVPFPIDWNSQAKFDAIAKAVLAADAEFDDGFKIRWGGNWDGDDKPHEKGETDTGHFELKAKV